MISWISTHADVTTFSIYDHNQNVIASWKPEVLSTIFKLNPSEIFLNGEFLDEFHDVPKKKNKDYNLVIKNLLHDPEGCKFKKGKDYLLAIFKTPFRYIIKMLSRLYGEANPK